MCNYRVLYILFISLLLSACATAPDVKDMIVDVEPGQVRTYDPGLENNIAVKSIGGGDETNPLWTSEIETEGFKSALVESLKASGLLSAEENAASYHLSAEIQSVDQPMFGFDMTVTAVVKYTLTAIDRGNEIFIKTLTSKHTATMGDAFYGPERLKIANEGAVKQNITQLLEELSKLRF